VAGTVSPDELYAAHFVGHQPGQQNQADIHGIEAGKIAENWVSWDKLGLLEQMGAVDRS
jgi:hypothetical protein